MSVLQSSVRTLCRADEHGSTNTGNLLIDVYFAVILTLAILNFIPLSKFVLFPYESSISTFNISTISTDPDPSRVALRVTISEIVGSCLLCS